MKILIISNMYPSEKDKVYGTFVKIFTESVSALNSNGSTKLVAIKGRSKMPLKLFKYISFYIRELIALAFHNYDIIYVHTITFPIIPIKIVEKFRRLTLIFNTHGTDILGTARSTRIMRWLAKSSVEKSLAIISPSSYFKECVQEFVPGYPEKQIFISPSGGVDTTAFHPINQEKDNTATTIGYVSRIDKGKGWDIFVDSISMIVKKGYKVKALMAGRGSEEASLKEAITRNGLENVISYIGPVAHDKLPDIYRNFDVFIFPTTSPTESLGLVGLEAMACGIPVIGSEFAGPKCYIVDGYNGYLFRKGDANALLEKLQKFLDLRHEQKVALANGARQTAEKYETKTVMTTLFQFIVSVVNNTSQKL